MTGTDSITVELEALERAFDGVRAVDRVSFRFQSGDIFGFVGPNGAGKTTTMRILATIDLPDRGDARVGGHSVINDPDRVRRLIGFMPDHLSLYSRLTVEEYLDFFARAYGLRGGRRKQALDSVIEFTDLGELRDRMCDALSKGMRQRLGLARILMHDPQVLILDEPASALDPRARIEFRELLRQLAARGKAILISSHILTELSEICNRVAIIERGKILATGSLDEIRKGLKRTSRIRIALLDRLEEAQKELAVTPNVDAARVAGTALEIEYRGDEAGRAGLLRDLVQKGFSVTQFTCEESNLETIFMQITTGKVQ